MPPDIGQGRLDLIAKLLGILAAIGVEGGADLGGDGEAGGDGQAKVGHFREIRALAAEQIAHLRRALGLAVAERIDPLGHAEPLERGRPDPKRPWTADD